MVSALLAATQMAHAAKGNFTIKANLKNFGDSIVAIIPEGDDCKRDTIIAKNDKFTNPASFGAQANRFDSHSQ